MLRTSSVVLLTAVVVLAGGPDAAGQQGPLGDVIVAQWDKYKEGLKEYQFRQTKSRYNLLTGEQRIAYLTVEHRHRGAWKLTLGQSKDDGRRCCSLMGINSWYAFALEKDKHASDWRLKELDLNLADGVQLGGMDPTMDFFHSYSPYILGESGFLPTFLKPPGFSVTKTESAGTPEEGLSKIWFKVVPDEVSAKQKGIPIDGTGWLLLDPNCYWRIREFDLPFYSPGFPKFRAIANYKYNIARGNYPLLKQADIAFYPPDSSEKPSTRLVINYEFEKRIPAEIEFRLSGFGLPEPMGTPPIDGAKRWWLWLTLSAVGAVAIGFLFVKAKRRYSTGGSARPQEPRTTDLSKGAG